MKKINIIYSLFIFLFLITTVSAIDVNFVSPTPDDGSTINTRNFIVNATIDLNSSDVLDTVVYNWNNTNYTIYDDSLVLYYNFDNRSALGENQTYIVDYFSDHNATVYNGSTIVSGKYGNAFHFDGIDEKAHIGDSSLNYSNDFTFIFWINPSYLSGNSANSYTLLGEGIDPSNKVLDIYLTGNGDIKISYTNDTNGNPQPYLSGSNFIKINEWRQIAINFNLTEDKVIMYSNGEYLSTDSISDGLKVVGNTRQLFIGATRGYSTFYNGSIDDLMIFNKSLTATEINGLYKAELTKFNSTQDRLIVNESLDGLSKTYSIYADGAILQRDLRFLNNINLTSTSLSSIKSDFYGFSGHRNLLTNDFYIDLDNDGVATDKSDTSFWRNTFLSSKVNYIRKDMSLWNYYSNQTTQTDGVNLTGDLTNFTEYMTWAKANNIKTLWTVNFMPQFLADNSSGGCTDLGYCPANNYTIWGNIVSDFIDRVGCTTDSCEFEVWNEPDLQRAWLGNISYTNITRLTLYEILYNNTYNTIKTIDSNYKVGGATLSDVVAISPKRSDLFMKYALDNLTMDFFSFHTYINDPYLGNTWLQNKIDIILNNCTTLYNSACNDIRITEYNYYSTTKNQSANYQHWAMNYAMGLNGIFTNNKYQNVSIINYKLGSQYKYGANDSDYPSLYTAVSEAGLDNTTAKFYPTYWIMANYSRYAPSGGSVYNVTSDYGNTKAVFTKTSGGYESLILTNIENDYQNITIDASNYGFTGTMIDTSTGTLYDFSSGTADKTIVLEPYEVVYLTEPNFSFYDKTGLNITNHLSEQLDLSSNVNVTANTSINDRVIKSVASNLPNGTTLSTAIFTVDDCDGISTVKWTPKDQTQQTISDYTCSGNLLTVNNIEVYQSTESNELEIEYTSLAINNICDESDTTFLQGAAIAGILLTIILVGGALTFLFMTFNGYLDIRKFDGITLQEIIIGVMIVGLVFLVLATMAYLMGGNYCPAIT